MRLITIIPVLIGYLLIIPAAKADGKANFEKSCKMCHGAGMAGAPKVGDKAAWKDRIAKGKDALVKSAINGIGIMPPKGGNAAFSDTDIAEIVEYMMSQVK